MDREPVKLRKQLAVQIDDPLRVDRLPGIVRQRHIKATRAKSHTVMLARLV
jgi:hypothetical protein